MQTIIFSVIFGAVFLSAAVFLYFRRDRQRDEEVSRLKNDVTQGFTAATESIRQEMRHLQNQFGEHMRHQSDVLLKTNSSVNERLDKAGQVIKDVHRELGKMTNVARSIDDLQNILKAPKLRGGFGELFLGDLLAQILPREHFDLQHRFKGGEAVDAVIFLGDQMVPIDSKFPLESFQRNIAVTEGEIPKQVRRQFINDIKKHIQGVAKYIRTDEGTYDFALMYIPAENVYYEVAVKEDVGGEGREVLNYALQQKVIPVSPNTLYAYLMTVMVGLKGMQVEKHTQAMLGKMGRVQKDFNNFQKVYSKLGTHLENARKSYDDADKRLGKVENKLQEFGPQEEVVAELSEATKPQLESELPAELQ